MNGRVLFILSVLAVFCFQTDAFGDRTFRCKGHVIAVGDYTHEVLEKCGEPNQREEWEEEVYSKKSQVFDSETERYREPILIKTHARLERWTYNLGSQQFIRYLKFQNGQLIDIDTGKKGSN